MTRELKAAKPAPIFPTADQVPEELRNLRRWLAYKLEYDEEKKKYRKPPYSPVTGLAIGAVEKYAADWVTYEEVLVGIEKFQLSGPGIVFVEGDEHVGIDFDNCRVDGVIHPEVLNWLKWLPTYQEISPSGTGIHAIAKGKIARALTSTELPGAGGARLEAYNQGRYFTFTGQRIGETLKIADCQTGIEKLLLYTRGKVDASPVEADRPMTALTAKKIHADNLETLRNAPHGAGNATLNTVAFFAARAVAVLEGGETAVKKQLFDIVTKEWTNPHDSSSARATIESGWTSGLGTPLKIIDAAGDLDAWLRGEKDYASEEVLNRAKLLTVIDFQDRRSRLTKKLGWKTNVFEKEVKRRATTNQSFSDLISESPTLDEVRQLVENLIDENPKESARKQAENLIWGYLRTNARIFCCGGVGYLLLHDSDGVPVAVTRDGHDFSRLLIKFGVHPGSPMRDRVGKFIGTKCFHEGVRTETRLAFHFEPSASAAYVARDRGVLIKVTRWGFDEVPNGTDDQLFVFPDSWSPLFTRPLDEVGGELGGPDDFPKSDRIRRSLFPDGHLVRHLFRDASFEIRSMSEQQVRILLISYLLFLMMPGVVSERAMLQALGPSGSGKTFLLDLIGHLLMGSNFCVRPMPTDIKEFENQIINEYLIAYDNVSSIPRDLKDRFCQAVTGVEVVRRELFTTSLEARYKSKATISLSAINPPLPELEHANRTININFNERKEDSFVAKEELLRELNRSRDDIVLNLLRRMTLVLGALEAQRDYVPKVNVRLASIATFILRVARHEGWEQKGKELLDAWGEEQSRSSMQEDDISTAITRWMGSVNWKPDTELSATTLNAHLCAAMLPTASQSLSWCGKHLSLSKIIARNLKVYASRFGLKRGQSTLRNSRGTYSYCFDPAPELLANIREDAQYERENSPEPEEAPF